MSTKEINARVLLKYDTAENWAQATFIPKRGEMIIYAPDEEKNIPVRYKIGDGETPIYDLPFVTSTDADTLDGKHADEFTTVHIGSTQPTDGSDFWIDPNGAPTSVEDWSFELEDGTNDTKTVVVMDSDDAAEGDKAAILRVKQADGSYTEIPALIGSKGDPGTPGSAATVEIGSVTTGAAGSSASVTNAGTAQAAKLNFTIPKGEKGDPGNDSIANVTTTGSGNVITDLSYDESTQVLTATKGATYSNTHTITATATDDDVIVLTGTDGSNKVTYDAKHAKKGPSTTASTTKGATEDVTVTAGAGAKTIKVPKVTVDAYGHTTGLTEQTLSVTIPETLKNPKALTVGSKTYDGSSAVSITASDLGLSSAMKFIGTSDVSIEDGDVTNPITIDGVSTTVSNGNVAIYGAKEFIWNGSAWEEFGNEGNYKVKQQADSKTATATQTIKSISQNENGNVTVETQDITFPVTSVNGQTGAVTINVPTTLAGLTADSTHRTVTDAEKTTWNAKSNFSGNYNDLTNKPTIPTVPSSLPANGGNADTVDNKHASDFATAEQGTKADNALPQSGGTMTGTLYGTDGISLTANASSANNAQGITLNNSGYTARISIGSSGGFGIYGDSNVFIRPFYSEGTGYGVKMTKTDLSPTTNASLSLGTSSSMQYNNIYGKTIYQNGKQVANKEDVPSTTENWTFTLEDGSTVTKAVYVK